MKESLCFVDDLSHARCLWCDIDHLTILYLRRATSRRLNTNLFSFREPNGKDKLSNFLTFKHHISSLFKASNLLAPKHHTCFPFRTQMIRGKTPEQSLFSNSFLCAFSKVFTTYSLKQLAANGNQAIELSSS